MPLYHGVPPFLTQEGAAPRKCISTHSPVSAVAASELKIVRAFYHNPSESCFLHSTMSEIGEGEPESVELEGSLDPHDGLV